MRRIALLLAVFPANLHMALHTERDATGEFRLRLERHRTRATLDLTRLKEMRL